MTTIYFKHIHTVIFANTHSNFYTTHTQYIYVHIHTELLSPIKVLSLHGVSFLKEMYAPYLIIHKMPTALPRGMGLYFSPLSPSMRCQLVWSCSSLIQETILLIVYECQPTIGV